MRLHTDIPNQIRGTPKNNTQSENDDERLVQCTYLAPALAGYKRQAHVLADPPFTNNIVTISTSYTFPATKVLRQNVEEGDEENSWKVNLSALSSWITNKDGQYPKRTIKGRTNKLEEARLAAWMHTQRHRYKDKRLLSWQAESLEKLKQWSWDTHQNRWAQQYQEVKCWAAIHHQLPSRYSKDERTAELGKWVHCQCCAYSGSRIPLLSEERVQQLLAVRAWKFPIPRKSWETMFTELRKYTKTLLELPSQDVHVETKTCWLPLGAWLNAQLNQSSGFAQGTTKQMAKLQRWQESLSIL